MNAAFAIPGDKDQRTGGYIYDATVLRLLNETGCPTSHLELPASFPTPSAIDMTAAFAALSNVPKRLPILVDGLALGALDPKGLTEISAPIIALVHHPLGLETGLPPESTAALIQNETQVLKQVAHVIVTSEHVAYTLTADFDVPADRITVALPGVENIQRARAPMDPPLILSVGLLAPRKGHDVLIEAFARVKDISWQAEIVGRWQDATYTAALQKQIAEADLTDRISLAGELEENDLQDAYRRASIFALATRYEGYGMVLGEAMMHGLPIVSSNTGAVPGTVGDAATLVPPDDAGAFADALKTLLENPEALARAEQASRARAATLPRWKDTARIIAGVIERVRFEHTNLERSVS